MPEHAPIPSPAPAVSAPPRPRVVMWLALGCVVLTAGWGAREWIKRESKRPDDPTPLPRPMVNAPYVQTKEKIVERMLALAEVGPDDVVYDLGCGDGRIVVAAARQFGCRCFGYDIDPERVAEARENARQNGVEELVSIEQRDVFTLDLGEATVITLYLLPRLNVKLIPQLEKLKPGVRIVSHDFDMEGVKPDQVEIINNDEGSLEAVLYLWTTPLKPADKKPSIWPD